MLVTAPDLKTARRLAKKALRARLIACANVIPALESHYRWEGKIESARETLLVLKTRRSNLVKLEKLILAEHPYDTPGISGAFVARRQREVSWLAGKKLLIRQFFVEPGQSWRRFK